jgi:muconolactone delta-isomerase
MTEKEIELQVLLDNDKWIERVLNEDKQIYKNKINNENNVRKMWRRTGNIPEISFIKGK